MDLTLAALAVFAAQIIKGITGFGSALIQVPLLTFLWGPREAVFVSAALEMASSLLLVPSAWNRMRAKLIAAVFVPMSLGLWVGTGIFASVSDGAVTLAVGFIVLSVGADIVFRPVREGRGELEDLPENSGRILAAGGVAGACAGVLAGLTTAGGPPLVIYFRHYFRDRFFRAQLIGVFAFSSALLPPMLYFRGQVSEEAMTRALYLLLPLIAGGQLGAFLSARFSPDTFGRLVGLILVGSGISLLLSALPVSG